MNLRRPVLAGVLVVLAALSALGAPSACIMAASDGPGLSGHRAVAPPPCCAGECCCGQTGDSRSPRAGQPFGPQCAAPEAAQPRDAVLPGAQSMGAEDDSPAGYGVVPPRSGLSAVRADSPLLDPSPAAPTAPLVGATGLRSPPAA